MWASRGGHSPDCILWPAVHLTRKFPNYGSVTEAAWCAGCVWPWPRNRADLEHQRVQAGGTGHPTKLGHHVAFSQQWLSGCDGCLVPSPHCPQQVLVLLCPAQGLCAGPPPPLCTWLESVPRGLPAHWLRGPAGVAARGDPRRKALSLVPGIVTTVLFSLPAAIGAQRLCMVAPGQAGPKGVPALCLACSTPPHFPF